MKRTFRRWPRNFKEKSEEEKRNLKVNVLRIPEWEKQIDDILKKFESYDLNKLVKSAKLLYDIQWRFPQLCIDAYNHSRENEAFNRWIESLSPERLIELSDDYQAPTFLRRGFKDSPLQYIEKVYIDANKRVQDIEAAGITSSSFYAFVSPKFHEKTYEAAKSYLDTYTKLLEKRNEIAEAINIFEHITQQSREVLKRYRNAQRWLDIAKVKKEALDRFEGKHGNVFAKAASVDRLTRSRAGSLKRLVQKTEFCPYCGNKLGKNAHLDHIYPVARGGLSIIENLVWCCEDCNKIKSEKGLLQFLTERGVNLDTAFQRLRALGKHI